ncbi:heme NO-binding domain-containing protein [Kushneria indalinina]|uniref:Heme-NO-binding protein n=1 Tax=Kushneria indalinina DSM 14324 TaxID=1122140 RepID=A0A3D9DXV2_9GAMM|nr:heme NO-binding domain-containing protein [Kushneria indalinina]REC95612.1 heme-NO-binding protein [Kushneria indalinina DSM 14324]
MKGIIFNMFNDIVVSRFNEQTWEALLENARVSGAYSSLGNYDDQDMFALVGAASHHLGMTPQQCLHWMGREMLPRLGSFYPGMLERFNTTFSTLKALNNVIHPEVVRYHPDAVVPVFHYHEVSTNSMVMEYRSARGICSLAHGLMQGCSDYFNESVEIDHIQCRHRGDEHCLFRITIR